MIPWRRRDGPSTSCNVLALLAIRSRWSAPTKRRSVTFASLSIKSRIARPGIESSERLGRHRWVVERTFAWLGRYRRLSKDYEALPATEAAWISCAMTCLMLARLAR